MIRSKREKGNAIVSFICGIAGIVVGTLLVMGVTFMKGTPITQMPDAMPSTPPSPDVSQPSDEENSENSEDSETSSQSSLAPTKLSPPISNGESAVANAVSRVAPAVVNIDTTVMQRVVDGNPFSMTPYSTHLREIPQGMGTGVIVSSEGVVLTNNHVIATAKTIKVTLSDKKQYTANIIGKDPISDLAILKIDGKGPFPEAHLTSSESMHTGDWVVAIGNPLGVGQTATVGVLSAKGRSISDSSVDLRNLLQTDAAINPGNSGGPLINMAGQVVGINTAIIPYAQGIGFAIPAEVAQQVISDLLLYGKVSRPYLGIEMGELNEAAKAYLELSPDVKGVLVGRTISQAPAAIAGITSGDVITKINDTDTPTPLELQNYVRSLKVGTEATVTLIRQKKEMTVTVKLYEMPTKQLPNR